MKKALWTLSLATLFASAALPARAYSFVGTWHGSTVVSGMHLYSSLVLEANGEFNELDRSGRLMTEQTGDWRIIRGMLYLEVLDWQPKEQCLQTGCFPIRKPPGSLYRVQWLSSNVMRCQDVNFGGSITYQRV